MSFANKHSWGLTALAATSSLGAWLLWRSLASTTATSSSTKKRRGDKKNGSFDFLLVDTSKGRSMTDASERSNASTATTTSSSTLGEDEIEQVWASDGQEVNLKILRQLLQQKETQRKGKSPRAYSRLSLFSHLVTRLEQTLDERNRIEEKLGHMRIQQATEANKTTSAITSNADPSPTKETVMQQSAPSSTFNNTSVCMVVQRYRGATLLCNEEEVVRVGADTSQDHTNSLLKPDSASGQAYCGLLVYVSFAKGCTRQAVQAAAKIVVNLPLLTLGGWGDGVSQIMNVIDLAKEHPNAASITIVPQANLISKIKGQGKSIQYHSQIDKSEGNTLYHYFVNSVRGLVLEQQCQWRKEPLPGWYSKACSAQEGSTPERTSHSIPPEDLFRNTSLYKSWDDNGIPLTDAEDEPITKSAQKKLRKAQAAHRVRHLKYLRSLKDKGGEQALVEKTASSANEKNQPQQHIEHWATAIDPSFVHVVAGTFGKRQSLEFVSSMGPLCHIVQV